MSSEHNSGRVSVGGEGATVRMPPVRSLPLAGIIKELVALQRQRRFCIVSQSRLDRSCESYIARLLGYRVDLLPAERKKLFAEASAIRKMVERGEGHLMVDAHPSHVLPAISSIVAASAQGRSMFDQLRKNAENRMRELSRSLPAYDWAQTVAGFGDLGLAIIAAECPGDNHAGLGDYSGPAKLWKRLGLAVINGERQRKKLDKDEAAAHGYNPHRRATIYGDIGTPLFFAKARSQYGLIYAERRIHTAAAHPDWTKGHSDNDARRYITKRLVRDLWRAWKEARREQE